MDLIVLILNFSDLDYTLFLYLYYKNKKILSYE